MRVKLVIPVMCSILFLLVIGGSEDAFAVLKTCNGYTGLWTDSAAWSPAGQPATTDTLSITNCNLTIPQGTNVLIEEGLPPAGIDLFLPPAYATEAYAVNVVNSNISIPPGFFDPPEVFNPAGSLTFDLPNSGMSFNGAFFDSLGDGAISMTAAEAAAALLVILSADTVDIEILVLILVSADPVDIFAKELTISNTDISDIGAGGNTVSLVAEKLVVENSSVSLNNGRLLITCLPPSGAPETNSITNSNFSLSGNSFLRVEELAKTALPLEVSNVTFNLSENSRARWDVHSYWAGTNSTTGVAGEGAGRFIFGPGVDTTFVSGTTTFETRVDFHGNTPNFTHNALGSVVRLGDTARSYGAFSNDGNVEVDTTESFIILGTYTVGSTGTHNNNANGLTAINSGGAMTVQNGGSVNNDGRSVTRSGGTLDIQSGANVNNAGIYATHAGTTSTLAGEWNDQSNTHNIFGTFTVQSGGVYNIESTGRASVGSGGALVVESMGIVNNNGVYVPIAGSTTTISGTGNEQAGNTNRISGTFNVASGGVYNIELNGLTQIQSGANFNLQNGGMVNNFGKFVVLTGGTATLDDAFDNNSNPDSITRNWATMNVGCNGSFDDVEGSFAGNARTDIC